MGLTSALDNLFGAFKKPAAKAVSQVKNLDSRVIKTGAAIGKNNKALGAGAGVAKDVAKQTAKTPSGLAKVGSNVVSVVGSKPVIAAAALGAGAAGYIKIKEMNKNVDAGLGVTDGLIDLYRDETAALKERMELLAGGAGPQGSPGSPGSDGGIFDLGGATGTASPSGSGGGSSGLVTFLVVGAVAGGGYLAYKVYKKRKK